METYESSDGTFKVYAAGFKTYLSDEVTMYYIDDTNKPEELILKLIDELLRSKYNKTTFYCHNLAGYDIVFILKVWVNFNESHDKNYNSNLSFKLRDNSIISFTISKAFGKVIQQLTILDSYAMFNSSLRDLAKSYHTSFFKSYFPYKFST